MVHMQAPKQMPGPNHVLSSCNNISNNNESAVDGNVKHPFPKPDDVSSMLAKEMNALSIQEREKIYYDIHGVSQIIEEPTEFISQKMIQLQQELDIIKKKNAYDMVDKEYSQSSKLRLQFLRANEFDTSRAARNMVTFFEYKLLWWGKERLSRPIEITDLDADDLAVLKTGWMQVLPFRDKAGRPVVYGMEKFQKYKTPENMFRSAWFMFMSIFDDDETQKLGCVTVTYMDEAVGAKPLQPKLIRLAAELIQFLPIRLVAAHYCVDSNISLGLVALLRFGVGLQVRTRTRVYQGSDMEMQYELLTFGVPVQFSPLSYTGELKTKAHKQWVQKQFMKNKSILQIDLPSRNDILVARGVPVQHHFGNMRCNEIVDGYMKKYAEANPSEKKNVISHVLLLLREGSTTRFLQQDPNGRWVEVDDKEARKKIACRLRNKQHNRVR